MSERKGEPLFNAGAAVYDSFVFLHAPAERTAVHACLKSGDDVLDVACGSGRTAMTAAGMVRLEGTITGIDIAEKLLAVAKEKTNTIGLNNIVYSVGDAENLDYESERFDAVTCASSLFLFENKLAVIKESLRVLRPGGILVFSTFGEGIFQPVYGMIDEKLACYPGIHFPLPVTSVTDSPVKCCDILESADVRDYRIITEDLDIKFTDAEECWRQTANSLIIRPRLSRLEKEQYQEVKAEILRKLEPLQDANGIHIKVPVIFLILRK